MTNITIIILNNPIKITMFKRHYIGVIILNCPNLKLHLTPHNYMTLTLFLKTKCILTCFVCNNDKIKLTRFKDINI